MNLYLLSQTEIEDYDTYDSCVVAAESVEQAARIHPSGRLMSDTPPKYPSWATKPERVTVTLIGTAVDDITEPTVICSSFNAG